MNPSDWISIYQILVLRGDETNKPHIEFIELIMQIYMFEMGKYDVVVAGIMKMKPHVVEPTFVDYGINANGLIVFDPWGIVVKISLNGVENFSKNATN